MAANTLRLLVTFYALTAMLTHPASGQEPALPPCVVAQSGAKTIAKPATDVPQFYDEPQFTVSGVRDASQSGGHGSDTVRRTTETLTKETVALSANTTAEQAKDTVKDETALHAAVEREPGNAARHHALGDFEEKKGDALAAVQEYQRAAELSPSEINLFDWGAELLLHRAYEPAGEVFTKGRRLFPRSVRMAVGSGVAAYSLGSYQLAAQKLCEASDLDPLDANPYLFLGKLPALDSGMVPGVVERLGRFARLQPGNAWASYYYALGLWKRREAFAEDAGRVEGLLEKAIRLDPKLAVGYLQLGIVYAERKDLPRAIGAFQRALTADAELEEAHYRLGQAYRMHGEEDKSKVELEIYERISKKNNGKTERDRHEIVQFVYELRSRDAGATAK